MSRLCVLVLLLTAAVACATAPPRSTAGFDPDTVYLFGEGTRITCEHDGVMTVDLTVEHGRLVLNGEDIGSCLPGQEVRFGRDGELFVDGEMRARLPD